MSEAAQCFMWANCRCPMLPARFYVLFDESGEPISSHDGVIIKVCDPHRGVVEEHWRTIGFRFVEMEIGEIEAWKLMASVMST